MLGSFTEELVNRAIDWYMEHNMAYFRKSYVPSAIINKYNKNDCIVNLREKGDVDYYGVWDGRYVSFEVKETTKDVFLLSQIKTHQFNILMKIQEFSGISFLLLNFASHDDSCFLIYADVLRDFVEKGGKKITLEEASTLGQRVPILFPGMLDFLSLLRHSQ